MKWFAALTLGASLCLAGCAVGPKYQRPPIQASREPPHTTRKFGSPYRFTPPVRVARSCTDAGVSCVSRVT